MLRASTMAGCVRNIDYGLVVAQRFPMSTVNILEYLLHILVLLIRPHRGDHLEFRSRHRDKPIIGAFPLNKASVVK